MIVKELINDKSYENDTCELVDNYTNVNTMWGIDTVKITDADIEALKSGKCLYFNDGEYATVLYYDET